MSQTSPKTPSQPLNSDVYVILEESPDAILVRCPTYQQPPDPKDIKSLFVDQHPYFNVGHLDLVRITATDAAKTSYLFAQKMAASIIANIMGSWEVGNAHKSEALQYIADDLSPNGKSRERSTRGSWAR